MINGASQGVPSSLFDANPPVILLYLPTWLLTAPSGLPAAIGLYCTLLDVCYGLYVCVSAL